MNRKKLTRIAMLLGVVLFVSSTSAFASTEETVEGEGLVAIEGSADFDAEMTEVPPEADPELPEDYDDRIDSEDEDEDFVEVPDAEVDPEPEQDSFDIAELPEETAGDEDTEETEDQQDAETEELIVTLSDIRDDAEEYGRGQVISINDDMQIGGYFATALTPDYKEISGFRFPDIELPAEAEIEDAYIEFTTLATAWGRQPSNMVIRSELGDPAQYSATAKNISQRSYSSQSVRYQQEAFTETLQIIRTPNLRALIDENRLSGWQSGQALAFMLDGDNYIGSVYQGSTAYSPRLVIKYKLSGSGPYLEGAVTDPTEMRNLFINEVSLNDDSGTGRWIELYNDNEFPVVFSEGFALSTLEDFSDSYPLGNLVIPAEGHYLLQLDDSFRIDDKAARLYLGGQSDKVVTTLDEFPLSLTGSGETIGRFNDGSPHVVAYKGGTPGGSNDDAVPMLRYAISHETGSYEEGFELTITTDSANTVKYTLDGTAPGRDEGLTYSGGITIQSDTVLNLYIYNEKINSDILTHTYMVGQEDLERRSKQATYRIQSGNDDAMVSATTVDLASAYLNLNGAVGRNAYATYLRFANVNLPEDAVITKAYLTFSTYAATSGGPKLRVTGEVGDGAAFTNRTDAFQSRVFTNSSVEMTAPDLAVNTTVSTADLTRVINEMRAGGSSMTSYVFRVEGDRQGAHAVRSYNYNPGMAPCLVLEYYSGYSEFTASITDYRDDAEEYGVSNVIAINDDMQIGGYFSTALTPAHKEVAAFRFANVDLPVDAEIVDAYMEFTTLATARGRQPSNMIIRAELGDPTQYTVNRFDISSRSYGNLAVRYQQEAFTDARQTIRTPNLKDLIDENRLAGWKSGQALAFMIDGDSYIGSVYQGSTAYSPRLVIQYRYSGAGAYIDGAETDPERIRNVYVNEVSAEGTSQSKETWVELYNDNEFPVVLGPGTYLSHNKKKPENFEFSSFVIPAKSYRIVYCDKKTELGNDHASFEVKSSGDVVLSAKKDGKTYTIDTLSYSGHLYNQTYGRRQDGGKDVVLFAGETFGTTNNGGYECYDVRLSHERGVYDTGFRLSIEAKPGTVIRYTTDGSTPGLLKGTVYSGPIDINKSCIVKIFAFDEAGISGVVHHTYVLKDNLKNEVRDGARWRYRDSITDSQYGEAISEFPIVSVSGDQKQLVANADYVQTTFEYLDAHLGGENYVADVGAKKFGQASITQYNSNVGVRFKRDYNSKKAKYPFFDKLEGDAYPAIGKYGRLDFKEGQDGPQNDIYNLGYLRYSEKVTNTLAKQMDKYALSTRYVHYFYNGQYVGLKTMREHFNDNTFEEYFGGDADDYTKIRFQDGGFVAGVVDKGDGDPAMLRTVKEIAARKDFQQFKQYVDVDNFIKTQILYMFIDSEREIDAVIHNGAAGGKGVRMMFNINDTDGAFFNNKRTGTTASTFAGGGGTYRYKWQSDTTSRNGAGGMFGAFSGNSATNAKAGNLEFKTLVKDQVLEQIGPSAGDFRGAPGAPLSVDNVTTLLKENQQELERSYRLDAAYMSARSGMYEDWQKANANVLAQVEDRVRVNLEMWKKYGMAHTLEHVRVHKSDSGISLENPNNGTVAYFTVDGSDPMGADGVVSPSATAYQQGDVLPLDMDLVIRPFTDNNWGPMTKA